MAQTTDIKATRIIGSVGCGKTEALIDHVRKLLEDGVEPAQVLVACATPQASLAFKQRLAEACGEGAACDIVATTPRAAALDVLSDSEARRWSGREPRILTAYEELFLLEDMKVSGLRPKRLREMLKFFYRSWTELADDDENWLLAGEESNIHELLKANLSFTKALAEPEAANLAVNYLRTHDGARAAHTRQHVLVDDYQMISKASQTLMGLLASQSLTIAGDPVACVTVYDSYPYAAGIDEFSTAYPEAKDVRLDTCYRCEASSASAQRLLADPALATLGSEDDQNTPMAQGSASDASSGAGQSDVASVHAEIPDSLKVLTFDLPENEFLGIADYVSDTIDEDIKPEDVVIATPNGVWGRNIAKALANRNVPAAVLADRQPVRGDIRDYAKCIPARILTALDLIADPSCALAWRCWCGYGDWLANSSAMASLRAYADEQGIGLVEALDHVFKAGDHAKTPDSTQIVGAQRVADSRKAGLAMIAAARDLKGEQLLKELTRIVTGKEDAAIPQVVRDLCLDDEHADDASAGANDSASAYDAAGANGSAGAHDAACTSKTASNSPAAMAARFRSHLLSPTIASEGAVKVVPFDQCVGLSPKLLIIAGFVNGFIPCRAYFDGAEMPLDKQEREHEKDVRRVYALTGKANERLVLSRFSNTDLESAGVLKLHIGRIRLRDGVRMCQIPPSDFTEQITPAPSGEIS